MVFKDSINRRHNVNDGPYEVLVKGSHEMSITGAEMCTRINWFNNQFHSWLWRGRNSVVSLIYHHVMKENKLEICEAELQSVRNHIWIPYLKPHSFMLHIYLLRACQHLCWYPLHYTRSFHTLYHVISFQVKGFPLLSNVGITNIWVKWTRGALIHL